MGKYIFFYITFLCCANICAENLSCTDFANYLFEQGFYNSAIKEYGWAIFSGYRDTISLYVKIGDSYRRIGEASNAHIYYEKAVDSGDKNLRKLAHFRLVELDLLQEKPFLARFELKEMQPYDFNESDSARWEYLWALSYIYSFENDTALMLLEKASLKPFYKKECAITINRARSYMSTHLKNPYLAMIFSSLIPGAGHFYVGKKVEGFGSFALNTGLCVLLFYSAYKGYQAYHSNQEKGVRVACMDFTLIFTGLFMRYYHGGRRNAFHYAIKANGEIQQNYLNEISKINGLNP